MSKLVNDYIKVYNGYDQDELDLIVDTSENFKWQSHSWHNYDNDIRVRDEGELEISRGTRGVAKLVQNKSLSACNKYVAEDDYGFGINGISPPRFNRYKENTDMTDHIDHITRLFDGKKRGIPIVSIVTVFNNDYEGGDFIFNDTHNVKLSAGDILIFPSIFMFKHRVNTVTKGTRLSSVSWVW